MGKKGQYTPSFRLYLIGALRAFRECSIEAFYLSNNVETLGYKAPSWTVRWEIHLGAGIKLILQAFSKVAEAHENMSRGQTEQISNYAFDESPLTDLYVSASIPYCRRKTPSPTKVKLLRHLQCSTFLQA